MGSEVDHDRLLQLELDAIRESRTRRIGPPDSADTKLEEDLFGVAFSGGGIRSATFNLGVLQALARHGLLKRIDYLSTVSGGGYIGSWLQAWISRSKGGVRDVERELAGPEPQQVAWLRRFSNYLTPRLGIFGGDTWAVVAIYLRNLLLTQTALLSGIVIVLALTWTLFSLVTLFSAGAGGGTLSLIALTALAAFAFAMLGRWRSTGRAKTAQAALQVRVVVPLLGAGVFAAAAARAFPGMGVWSWAPTFGLIFGGCWMLAAASARRTGSSGPTLRSATLFGKRQWAAALFAGVVAGAVLGKLGPAAEGWSPRAVAVCLPPLVLLLFALASTIQLGVVGRAFSDPSFEWWGRLGGWLLLYAFGWFAVFGLALYGARILDWVAGIPASLPAWIASWGAGLLAARSGGDRPPGERSMVKTVLTTIAPYAFVAGLLVLMAAGFEAAVNSGHEWLLLALLLVSLVVVWRFSQINRLSLHGLYRNRLVRCYLGASNQTNRREDVFTGFSPGDDLPLTSVRTDAGPFAIVNTAVNLSSTSDLAWQERRAAAFSFTPHTVGYTDRDRAFYRPTSDYGGGYSLGAAMAISGAAASPNMGFRTSAPFAFLMSMFNVRLGWWSGNPADDETYTRMTPERFGFRYLLRELFGNASVDAPYVYLSDGGHFENLGLYELVRRRCRFIVVSDAGCDPKSQFDDLGNAVRKCRTDLDVQIEIDVHDLDPGNERTGARHCAVGTIRYPDGPRGTLLYLKPTLTGDEPVDVRNYAAEHPRFPHQTTGDQWFAESQFESYRRLGRHIADRALDRAGSMRRPLTDIFTDLRYGWYATARADSATRGRHAAALDDLVVQLRTDPDLAFLDRSFWPEWEDVANDLVRKPRSRAQTAKKTAPRRTTKSKLTADQFRAGFYFCQSLIQLVQSVFLDLHLDQPEQRRHPDNRGWINLFRHFSWSAMFRVTWAVSAGTYGARLQNFCRDALDLGVGDSLQVTPWKPRKGAASTVAKRWNTMLNRVDDLNFHERDLLGQLVLTDSIDWAAGPLTLMTFRMDVVDPSGQLAATEFGCGFAVIQQVDGVQAPHLCALRIPDHLRQMGLARRALVVITSALGAKPVLAPRRETRDLFHAVKDAAPVELSEHDQQVEALRRQLDAGRRTLGWILDSIDA